ncbi:MAG: ATP synthase F0 subunit B [Ilumatobacteraceae bacterium]
MSSVTLHIHGTEVLVPRSVDEEHAVAEDKGPSPIAPEIKELAWGAGAFIVLFILMRVWLFPRLKKGMDARYGKIRGDHETADATRAAAQTEVAEYEAEIASLKKQAAERLEAARGVLESERTAALAEANGRIAVRRTESNAASDAARAAAAEHVQAAVADVSSRAAELATGRKPQASVVTGVVEALMAGGTK